MEPGHEVVLRDTRVSYQPSYRTMMVVLMMVMTIMMIVVVMVMVVVMVKSKP